MLNFDLAADPWTIELVDFNRFLQEITTEFGDDAQHFPAALDHDQFLAKVQQFVGAHVRWHDASPRFDKARYAVVYLLAAILCRHRCGALAFGFVVTLKSGITMGAGLGSSAAYGVCLAAAFHFYALYRLAPACTIATFNASSADVKRTISEWAFCSERLMHGNPSGLDNTICTMGNLLRFRKGEQPEPVALAQPLNVLLVNTRVDRSTATLVAQVAALKTAYPPLVQHLLDAMGTVVEDIIKVILD